MDVQWAVGVPLVLCPFIIYLWKKYDPLLAITVSYVSIQSLSVTLFYHAKYSIYDIPTQTNLVISNALSVICTLVLLLGVSHIQRTGKERIRSLIGWYTVSNAAYTIFFGPGRLLNGHGPSGYLDYAGMNACMIACGISYLIPKKDEHEYSWYLKVFGASLSLFAIFLTKSAVPYGVLSVVFVGWAIMNYPKMAPIGIVPLVVGAISIGPKMINSSQRFTAYKVFLSYLFEIKRQWFGTGMGTFQVYAPVIQNKAGFMFNQKTGGWLWLWIHSDPIQAVFEIGIIGFLLVLCLFLRGLLSLYKKGDWQAFCLLLSLGATAAFNYPARYFPTAFLGMFFLLYSLEADAQKPHQKLNL